jgi:hypothetical protein
VAKHKEKYAMRLKILAGFIAIAWITGGCAFSESLMSGPNLPSSGSGAANQGAAGEEPLATPASPVDESAQSAASGDYPFGLDTTSPRYLPAFTRPEAGCGWVGVAGQVFDPSGAPLDGVTVAIKGYFNDQLIDARTVTGQQTAYGEGGFEVQVGDRSAQASNALTVQLFNHQGEALSEVYSLNTFDDCQRNLILVNFQAQGESWQARLP